ncbi:MAG: OsmC family protein [Verrucomicrobiota bacterium]
MAEPRARVFEYAVAYDGTSVATAKGATVDVPEAWSPEHLVLAGLLDCSLTSLRYHAKRSGVEVTAEGEASGTVTRREEDDRFAFVDIEARFDVRFDPAPGDREALLRLAERDCFVGASLTAKPRYVWNVA